MLEKDLFFKTSDGSLIHYVTSGSGLPILLLHGNNGNLHYFSKQIEDFSKYLKVFALDSRDHGESTNTKDTLDFQLMAEDLHEFILEKKLKQVILLGFSDGANLAMAYALQYPETLLGLILNGGNLAPLGLNFMGNLLTKFQLLGVHLLAFFSKKSQRLLRIAELQTKEIGFTFEDLRKIKVPTLIITGQFDLIADPHSQKIAAAISDSRFVVIKGGLHNVAKQKPAVFNSYVLKFIKEKVGHENHSRQI